MNALTVRTDGTPETTAQGAVAALRKSAELRLPSWANEHERALAARHVETITSADLSTDPPTKREVRAFIAPLLATMANPNPSSDAEAAIRVAAYDEVLMALPATDVRAAARAFLHGNVGTGRFAPSPAEIAIEARAAWERRLSGPRIAAAKLRGLVNHIEDQRTARGRKGTAHVQA